MSGPCRDASSACLSGSGRRLRAKQTPPAMQCCCVCTLSTPAGLDRGKRGIPPCRTKERLRELRRSQWKWKHERAQLAHRSNGTAEDERRITASTSVNIRCRRIQHLPRNVNPSSAPALLVSLRTKSLRSMTGAEGVISFPPAPHEDLPCVVTRGTGRQ